MKRAALAGALACVVGCGSGPVPEPPRPPAPVTPQPPAASTSAAPAPTAFSAAPLPPAAPPARGRLKIERTLPLATWPERVVVIGDDAWVTESGKRRVARLSLKGDAPPTYVPVGRLPVDLALAPNGKLYAVAQTDKQVWEIDPSTAKAKVFSTLPDCPEAMAIGGNALWVLLWTKCSSAGSSVVRVGLSDRKQSMSPPTGKDAWSLAHGADRAWIAVADGTVAVLGDPSAPVATVASPKVEHTSRVIASGPNGIYLSEANDVVRIDPATSARARDARLDHRVLTIFADERRVVVGTRARTLWLLDPETLETQQTLRMPVADADPRDVAPYGDGFVWIDPGPDREHARLFVLSVVSPEP